MFAKSTITLALICAVSVSAYAAPILTFSESGEDLTVTAADGGTAYWSLVVKTGAALAPGRITQFYDLTGASDPAYNYVHRYDLGPGLVDPNDNGSIRDGGKYSIAFDAYADGDTSLSYTLSRVDTDGGGGTKTTTMDFVINVPDLTGTKIDMATTLAFDALWTAGNSQGRVRPQMNVHNSVGSDNGEWTIDAYNGFPDGVGYSYIEAVSTGVDAGSAAGRSFTMTLGWDAGDSAYDATVVGYGVFGPPNARFNGQIAQGITGAWAGKPTAGESYTASVDMDINIVVPEPATLSLLGVGLVGLLRRRR